MITVDESNGMSSFEMPCSLVVVCETRKARSASDRFAGMNFDAVKGQP